MDIVYLKSMYNDNYFPNHLVDKIKVILEDVVLFLENGTHSNEEIQKKLDEATDKINDLQDEFEENDSEIETAARDSIAVTVEKILIAHDIDIDIEEALRNRDW